MIPPPHPAVTPLTGLLLAPAARLGRSVPFVSPFPEMFDPEVTVNGKPVTYTFLLDTSGAPPIFTKDFLQGFRCVPRVAN